MKNKNIKTFLVSEAVSSLQAGPSPKHIAPLKMSKTLQTFASLSGDQTQDSTFSTNITSLFIDCSEYCNTESTLFDAPSINLILQTNPSLPLIVAMIFGIGPLLALYFSFNSTISPTLQIHFGESHFCQL